MSNNFSAVCVLGVSQKKKKKKAISRNYEEEMYDRCHHTPNTFNSREIDRIKKKSWCH